jgi:hypothetical protein
MEPMRDYTNPTLKRAYGAFCAFRASKFFAPFTGKQKTRAVVGAGLSAKGWA